MEFPKAGEDKLLFWQGWLTHNRAAYSKNYERFERREKLYKGTYRTITGIAKRDANAKAPHIRNIVSENIEAEINSSIPQPKVTARRPEDEDLARIIENMLRNELDRMPMEELNDMMERTIPIQGGAFWMLEWDDTQRTGERVGECNIRAINPRQVVPQEGVYTSVEDMDAICIIIPTTKSWVKRKYGVSVEDEGERDVNVKGDDGEIARDMVDVNIAYYRDENGKIGRFTWCNNVELEDLEDYQQRRVRRCQECGEIAAGGETECTACGGKKIRMETLETEEIWGESFATNNGTKIPGRQQYDDGTIAPTALPWYKPDCFPIFLQRNISVYGQLLGDSDVDKIEDQQNTLNRLEKKIIDRIIKAGTRITLPDRADIKIDPEDQDTWYIGNPSDKNLIGTYDFSGNLTNEMLYMDKVYEEARQLLGITDSFQGRTDTTAKSGVAKQFAAAQSAGRLESKRVLKDAAYAEIFKRIFQMKLAYADEPRPVVSMNDKGDPEYTEFNRYDFLRQDKFGNWFYNDDFLFSCDASAPSAANRQSMWDSTTANFQAGAFGNPAEPATLIYYWSQMAKLHYPGAGAAKQAIQDQFEAQQTQMQAQQVQQAQQAQQAQQGNGDAARIAQQMAEREIRMQIEEAAKKDAAKSIMKR